MSVHFIADLHLQDARPQLQAIASHYFNGLAREADVVYLLGDLFEYWIGDDASLQDHRQTVASLRALSNAGTTLYFMRGNRDFAVGPAFERACGLKILADPVVIDLYGTPTLLSHGDLLCTDDVEHQAFRAKYTDPAWRRRMLRLPRIARRGIALAARARSKANKRRLPADIMDVNTDTVRDVMQQHGVTQLIHGHTHRPDNHDVNLPDAKLGERIVLSDWHDDYGEVLMCDASGCHRQTLT